MVPHLRQVVTQGTAREGGGRREDDPEEGMKVIKIMSQGTFEEKKFGSNQKVV